MPTQPREDNRDKNWQLQTSDTGGYDIRRIQAAILMDIRDEMQQLNALLHCRNFTGIPATLKAIQRDMPKRKKRATK